MDESKVLSDVLERLDRVTEHIIAIKSDMYKASDFRVDSGRIYDALAKIQTEVLAVIKDAVTLLDRRLVVAEDATSKKHSDHDERLKRVESKQIPAWAFAAVGAIGAALLHEALPALLTAAKVVHP